MSDYVKLPKATFAESVQSLVIFWAVVGDKPNWNPTTKKFDGPLRSVVTVGLKGIGKFNMIDVECVIFEDLGNYITLGKEGKADSKLYELLKAGLGEAKANSLIGKKVTPDGEKETAYLEGVGPLKGLRVAALVAHKKNGACRAKTFLAALPVDLNSFCRMDTPMPPREAATAQTGFENYKPVELNQPVALKEDEDFLPFFNI